MHPCRKCLVRPACSESCPEWRAFARLGSEIMTFISILIGAIVAGGGVMWLTHIADTTGAEWPRMALVFIWIMSFITVTILQAPFDKDEQITFIVRFCFAPMVLVWFTILHTTKHYFKRA